jgi:hypothetical protein
MLKKIYYDEKIPLKQELKSILKKDPDNHEEYYQAVLLHTLHKGGLLEDGITQFQFDVLYSAFLDSMDIAADTFGDQEFIA